ncbi:MAG: tripartite tricarboxylate transporter substrate binding protein [Comamonadaceae bacterium]|nr:tripartite tricarboxylate transporter substrate binding protein [Comamonadaceae bacterium]
MRLPHLLLASALLALSVPAAAQGAGTNFPDKPIRIVVPFPPGGPVDTLARLVATKVSTSMGQPFVVDNRAGAGGAIGAAAVSRSNADGYTLLFTASSYAMDPAIRSNQGFDPRNDLTGVMLVASGPVVLLAHPKVPVSDGRQLVKVLRENPHKYSYASTGIGTVNHFAGEMFKQATQTDAVHVPYSGAAPATQAILSGEVSFFFNNVLSSLPHIRSGKVKPLAVTSPQRWPALPDVPTLAEIGISGVEISSWYGLLAPAKTPQPILQKIAKEFQTALADPATQDRILQLGLKPDGMMMNDFQIYIGREIDKWTSVAQKAGIKPE